MLVLGAREWYVGSRRRSDGGDDADLIAEQASEVSRTTARSVACVVMRQMSLDCRQVLLEAWATDLGLPAWVVRAEQASEVSSTDARSPAYTVMRQMPLD